MTTKNIIFTRFNTSFDPDEPRFQQCVGNNEWWSKRFEILKNYFLPSLQSQTVDDFSRLVVFADQIPGFNWKNKCKGLLLNYLFLPVTEKDNKTKYHEPYKFLFNQEIDANFIRLICIDSDDLIIEDFIERINQIEPKKGQVIQSEGGYFYGVENNKLVRQQANKASEVFCKDIPVDVLEREEDYLEYLDKYNLDLYNNELHKADKVVTLDGYNFMQTIHGANDTTGWTNEDSKSRMECEIVGKKKQDILERFGIGEQSR